jgi:hypothetical protein
MASFAAMDAPTALQRAIPVFVQHAKSDLLNLRMALTIARVGSMVEEVVEFVPLAFGRSLMDGMGITFDDEYVRMDSEGRERLRRKLMDEPLYREALRIAPHVLATEGQDAFLAVAIRSAEFQAVNEALHAGSDPADLQASAPVMEWSEERHAAQPEPSKAKPWWKVW